MQIINILNIKPIYVQSKFGEKLSNMKRQLAFVELKYN